MVQKYIYSKLIHKITKEYLPFLISFQNFKNVVSMNLLQAGFLNLIFFSYMYYNFFLIIVIYKSNFLTAKATTIKLINNHCIQGYFI